MTFEYYLEANTFARIASIRARNMLEYSNTKRNIFSTRIIRPSLVERGPQAFSQATFKKDGVKGWDTVAVFGFFSAIDHSGSFWVVFQLLTTVAVFELFCLDGKWVDHLNKRFKKSKKPCVWNCTHILIFHLVRLTECKQCNHNIVKLLTRRNTFKTGNTKKQGWQKKCPKNHGLQQILLQWIFTDKT